jgi:hypothetical protein
VRKGRARWISLLLVVGTRVSVHNGQVLTTETHWSGETTCYFLIDSRTGRGRSAVYVRPADLRVGSSSWAVKKLMVVNAALR